MPRTALTWEEMMKHKQDIKNIQNIQKEFCIFYSKKEFLSNNFFLLNIQKILSDYELFKNKYKN